MAQQVARIPKGSLPGQMACRRSSCVAGGLPAPLKPRLTVAELCQAVAASRARRPAFATHGESTRHAVRIKVAYLHAVPRIIVAQLLHLHHSRHVLHGIQSGVRIGRQHRWRRRECFGLMRVVWACFVLRIVAPRRAVHVRTARHAAGGVAEISANPLSHSSVT